MYGVGIDGSAAGLALLSTLPPLRPHAALDTPWSPPSRPWAESALDSAVIRPRAEGAFPASTNTGRGSPACFWTLPLTLPTASCPDGPRPGAPPTLWSLIGKSAFGVAESWAGTPSGSSPDGRGPFCPVPIFAPLKLLLSPLLPAPLP